MQYVLRGERKYFNIHQTVCNKRLKVFAGDICWCFVRKLQHVKRNVHHSFWKNKSCKIEHNIRISRNFYSNIRGTTIKSLQKFSYTFPISRSSAMSRTRLSTTELLVERRCYQMNLWGSTIKSLRRDEFPTRERSLRSHIKIFSLIALMRLTTWKSEGNSIS